MILAGAEVPALPPPRRTACAAPRVVILAGAEAPALRRRGVMAWPPIDVVILAGAEVPALPAPTTGHVTGRWML